MNPYRALQIQALLAVIEQDPEYEIRRILRWYSKVFSTPLHQVEELPLEDVVRAYYEEKFESLDPEALERIREELLETEEERYERLKREDSENADAETYAKIAEAEEEEAKRKTAAKKAAEKAALPKVERQKPLAAHLGVGSKIAQEQELPSSLPTTEFPPDITIKFDVVDPDEFEREIEGLGSIDQPTKGR